MDKPFCELSVEVSRFFFGDEYMFVHLAGDFCWYILLIHSRLDHPSRADARCAAQIEGQEKKGHQRVGQTCSIVLLCS